MMRRFLTISLLVALCSSFLCTGCKTFGKKKRNKYAVDTVVPTSMDGELVLPERFEEGERIMSLDAQFACVYFSYDSYQVTRVELTKIEAVAEYMRRHPRARLIVEGHCDERGSREYNLSLGEARALAVRAQLIGLGANGARIQTRSYGEEHPVDLGHGEAAWRRNRRGEFSLYR